MSYENAPATRLLATHCACCGRALRDSVSVEAGVGPDCREAHGYGEAQGTPDWLGAVAALGPSGTLFGSGGSLTPEWGVDAHRASNILIHRFACTEDTAERARIVAALAALGYSKVAAKLAERARGCIEVRPAAQPERLAVTTPYDAAFVAAIKAARVGARWDRDAKVWTVPTDTAAKAALWRTLRAHFAGALLVSDRGATVIQAA